MSAEALSCWRCGASLDDVLRPISRFAECPACRADLHVCRMCRFYDPKMIGKCTHDRAERIEVKDRANFCTHFRPTAGAHDGSRHSGNDDAKKAFDALFATAVQTESPAELLGLDLSAEGPAPGEPSDEDLARTELNSLFGLSGVQADVQPDVPSNVPSNAPSGAADDGSHGTLEDRSQARDDPESSAQPELDSAARLFGLGPPDSDSRPSD